MQNVQSKVARFTNKYVLQIRSSNMILFRFAMYDQEDAHEFLMACIDQLSFEYLPSLIENIPFDPLELSKRDPIQNSIYFRIKHSLCCKNCSHQSTHSEVFRNLSLFFPEKGKVEGCDHLSIPKLLDIFFQSDSVEYTCSSETCSGLEALMNHQLESLPQTLLLHLNRFEMFGEEICKRADPVFIPLHLDLSRYFKQDQNPQATNYDLSGIITHLGSTMRNGHYMYSKRNLDSGKWTVYNDSIVNRNLHEGLERREACQAYIVVYELSSR